MKISFNGMFMIVAFIQIDNGLVRRCVLLGIKNTDSKYYTKYYQTL